MRLVRLAAVCLAICIPAAAQEWVDDWLSRVSATQEQQPHWVTPVVTVTPRLEQEIRYDFLHQQTPTGNNTSIGGGKGVELIPTHNTELIFNIPPYLIHSNPAAVDGWGDVSFLLKYRIASANKEHGDYIVTAFLAGSIPTGTYKNGALSAIVTPTIAVGKGWDKFDVQLTLGSGLPVDDTAELGRTLLSNTALQYHAARFLWPEVEFNYTSWYGGTNDGKKQAFITPGLVVGKIPIHSRVGLTMGAGFQVAATHFHQFNHAFVGTIRMPF
jgi:opacity protein-like surface antigen